MFILNILVSSNETENLLGNLKESSDDDPVPVPVPDTPNIDKEMENLENTSSTDDFSKKS